MNNDQPNNNDLNNEEESLRMENEFLHLKLKAEYGADSFSSGNLDPELENMFLKNIMAFENSYAANKRATVFEILGRPNFKRADELNDTDLDDALEVVNALLLSKNMVVDFSGAYENRIKYTFIVEELFGKETDDMQVPGMISHFHYEEYHPNHQLDIAARAEEFINGWFKRDLKGAWCLADEFVLAGDIAINKEALSERLKSIFDSYTAFTNADYTIAKIDFEFKTETGMGYAEGFVKYDAVLENGEQVLIKGPFKLYLSCEYGWWAIFHIVFPGFK
ncbi:hypothetical protein [Mucilaginibacter psychrotolerans]|uniref:Uncharacterized protein n=1 Tax=Mucilaginibacter psychrotolerans TaxID=1524096 RepID=A0A4Y8S5Z6_9SPHI|nr:hypothetical protein [Mucilaginibacter psychrotolerans]TFF33824.1 hypothetical protein E2R66_24135 [Mucilaginibacter psychrotolerans]